MRTQKSRMKENAEDNYVARSVGDCKIVLAKTHPVDHFINMINVYMPTSDKVEADEEEAESVYREIENLLNIFKTQKSSITFIAGDFNAKVGKRKDDEEGECIGRYSVGERNKSGELLMDFCNKNELFLTNTAFQHPATRDNLVTTENQ